jgi:hypothetical protein
MNGGLQGYKKTEILCKAKCEKEIVTKGGSKTARKGGNEVS